MDLVTLDTPHHEILRQHAQEVQLPLSAQDKAFIQNMYNFFDALESSVHKPAGLAAPQLGKSLRVIIINVPADAKKYRKFVYNTIPPTILINPSYTPILKEGKTKDWEGCYSIPKKMGEVYRYQAIQYIAYALDGKEISGTAKGFLARVIQHEVDHINGKLYIDLLSPDCRYGDMDKMMAIRKKEK